MHCIEDWEINPEKYKEKPKKMLKIEIYKERIEKHLEECQFDVDVSQRALAKELNIPWSSFTRVLNEVKCISNRQG